MDSIWGHLDMSQCWNTFIIGILIEYSTRRWIPEYPGVSISTLRIIQPLQSWINLDFLVFEYDLGLQEIPRHTMMFELLYSWKSLDSFQGVVRCHLRGATIVRKVWQLLVNKYVWVKSYLEIVFGNCTGNSKVWQSPGNCIIAIRAEWQLTVTSEMFIS